MQPEYIHLDLDLVHLSHWPVYPFQAYIDFLLYNMADSSLFNINSSLSNLTSSCRPGGPVQLSLLRTLPRVLLLLSLLRTLPRVLLLLSLLRTLPLLLLPFFENLATDRAIQLSSLIHHHLAKPSLLPRTRLLKVLRGSAGPGLQYRTIRQRLKQMCRLL